MTVLYMKLLDIIKTNFWHPSIDNILRDICASCKHCQFYKVHNQPIDPPTLKIQTDYPYQLMSVDLVKLPVTSEGHVGCFMMVDLNSKLLIAVPIKNQRSSTICGILEHQVFPNLLKIPNTIRSDNGPEFSSFEYAALLDKFNIENSHSTAYKASCNGAIERCNRTVIQLLATEYPNTWDKELNKAIRNYNSTYHSELKMKHKNFHFLFNNIRLPESMFIGSNEN